MPEPDGPFAGIRFRNLLFLAALSFPAVIAAIAISEVVLEPHEKDSVLFVVIGLWAYLVPLAWLIRTTRRAGVSLRAWLRFPGPGFDWSGSLGLIPPLILFSVGSFWLVFYPLSYLVPDFVKGALQTKGIEFAREGTSPIPFLQNALVLVIAILLAPVVEELLFRGGILHRWAHRWGVRKALVLTSLLFGVLHASVLGIVVLGFVFGMLYLRSRSLVVPIVCHSVNNAVASIGAAALMLVAKNGEAIQTLEGFRSAVWFGAACLAISVPWLGRFLWIHRDLMNTPLPDVPYDRPERVFRLGPDSDPE